MEYALKYQQHIKGLIISNMMASAPEYNKYAQEVLGPQMDPKIYAEIKEMEANEDFANPRYLELLINYHYTEHVLRMPVAEWPEVVNRMFKHLNQEVYVYMQGHSEFGITGNATLKDWDIKSELSKITVPTLVIGAKYDTMDPKHMEWMSDEVQNGRYLFCPNGSHCALFDDQKVYFEGLIKFIKDVDEGIFKGVNGYCRCWLPTVAILLILCVLWNRLNKFYHKIELMFKASLIEDPEYYRLRRKLLLIVVPSSIGIGLLGNFAEMPIIWLVFILLGVLGIMLYQFRIHKGISLIAKNRKIEIDQNRICIRSKDGIIEEQFLLNEIDQVVVKEDYTLPGDDLKKEWQVIKGNPSKNFLLLKKGWASEGI